MKTIKKIIFTSPIALLFSVILIFTIGCSKEGDNVALTFRLPDVEKLLNRKAVIQISVDNLTLLAPEYANNNFIALLKEKGDSLIMYYSYIDPSTKKEIIKTEAYGLHSNTEESSVLVSDTIYFKPAIVYKPIKLKIVDKSYSTYFVSPKFNSDAHLKGLVYDKMVIGNLEFKIGPEYLPTDFVTFPITVTRGPHTEATGTRYDNAYFGYDNDDFVVPYFDPL